MPFDGADYFGGRPEKRNKDFWLISFAWAGLLIATVAVWVSLLWGWL